MRMNLLVIPIEPDQDLLTFKTTDIVQSLFASCHCVHLLTQYTCEPSLLPLILMRKLHWVGARAAMSFGSEIKAAQAQDYLSKYT